MKSTKLSNQSSRSQTEILPEITQILEHLEKRSNDALKMLNEHYTNDSGRSCEDHAKGVLSAISELRHYIERDVLKKVCKPFGDI
jgi:hypothetical protein